MSPYRVLVAGGYGFFGRRLVQRLARHRGLQVLIAGRSATRGRALAQALQAHALAEVGHTTLDVSAPDLARVLDALRPHVVVHTCGPFQGQGYAVARACLLAGTHYIDLADGREFVTGITLHDEQARAAGVAVISGASSVPALSSAAADHLAADLATVHSVDIGISPGNRTERGLSTVQAILSYCGQPLPAPAGESLFGWSTCRRHLYPAPVGSRLLSPCDVPDLVLLPARYPGRPTVRFGAGLELAWLHRGMNLMAALTRRGWVPDWSRHAVLLKRAADLFRRVGSDAGAMHVAVTGVRADGQPVARTWHLVATDGDGPCVPTLAAAALVQKLRAGDASLHGARPCVGLLRLADFKAQADGLHIEMTETVA